MKVKLLSLPLVLMVCASAAFAEEGLYVRAEVGRSDIDDFGIEDSSEIFGVDAGWRFAGNFGAELGYRNLGKFKGPAAAPFIDLKADTWLIALSGKYKFVPEQTQGWYVDGRFGLANVQIKGIEGVAPGRPFDETGSRPYLSLGVGYEMTEQFGLAFSYSRYRFDRQVGTAIAARDVTFDLPALALTAEFRIQ
jgi:Outer membrane protein beta-barrel domain